MKKLFDKFLDYLNTSIEKARFASLVPAKSYVKINHAPPSRKV